MPGKDENNPFNDGNEADTEDESEIDETEAYDDDVNDEENHTKTQKAKGELLGFLKDWLDSQTTIVWSKEPDPDGTGGEKNKEAEANNPELYKIYYNIDGILRQAVGKRSESLQHYKELLQRVAPWVNKGKEQPSINYQDDGEISRLEYFIKNWELKADEEYQDKKDDINNAIDAIKGAIRQHLVNWKNELEPLIPKDLEIRKENAKNDLINWEATALLTNLKDWLTHNKKKNTEGHEVELTKKEQGLLKGLIKQTEGTIKSKKIEVHHKLMGNVRVKLSQLIEETIPEPDEAIPEASHYKVLFNFVNGGSNLFKAWSDLLTQADKPSQRVENAKKYIKYIDFVLIKDKLGTYADLVKRVKETDAKEEKIKPFEICITGGGTDCENHPTGGNWLNAWKKALGRLKGLEKGREREKEAKERPPCECLHCTHGLGAWTWLNCPFYDHSIYKDKELGKLGTIMGPDNAPHWIPPAGWTPFYNHDGRPNESKCNNRVNNKINKEVKWTWEPREEHGGSPKPRGSKGKEKPTNSTTHEHEPGADETIHI